MIETSVKDEKNYFLPEDGDQAKKDLLDLFDLDGEFWISAYGFNMKEMVSKILEADARGNPVHLLLDRTQSNGPSSKRLIIDLAKKLSHGDVTITTAGVNSDIKGAIWHWKSIALNPKDGSEPIIFEGSVNFTNTGWVQGNSARLFRSKEWFEAFSSQFILHKEWAIKERPNYQIRKNAPVSLSFHPVLDEVRAALDLERENCANKHYSPSDWILMLMGCLSDAYKDYLHNPTSFSFLREDLIRIAAVSQLSIERLDAELEMYGLDTEEDV